MSRQVRVLRILEYIGDEEWVQTCMLARHIKQELVIRYKKGEPPHIIREAVLGSFSSIETLPESEWERDL